MICVFLSLSVVLLITRVDDASDACPLGLKFPALTFVPKWLLPLKLERLTTAERSVTAPFHKKPGFFLSLAPERQAERREDDRQ